MDIPLETVKLDFHCFYFQVHFKPGVVVPVRVQFVGQVYLYDIIF